MNTAIDFVTGMVWWFVLLGAYLAPGGMVYARTRSYLYRNTGLDRDESNVTAAIAGVFWPISVPFLLLSHMMGNIDPVTRKEKRALLDEEEAEAEKRRVQAAQELAEARQREQSVLALEDMAVRKRARMAGEDIPYTREEELAIESEEQRIRRTRIENDAAEQKVQQQQLAIEASKRRYENY
jgi:hypothetical protein